MPTGKTASISPVMNRLSRYIAAAPRKPLPSAAVEATRHHVLDTLAAMMSGAKLKPGKMATAYVKSLGGMPARNGITAATMGASGCTGVDDVFSGERNFFVAFDESRRTRRAPDPDEKAHHLMAPVLGAKRARALCDTVWQLDQVKDVRKLRPLLQA